MPIDISFTSLPEIFWHILFCSASLYEKTGIGLHYINTWPIYGWNTLTELLFHLKSRLYLGLLMKSWCCINIHQDLKASKLDVNKQSFRSTAHTFGKSLDLKRLSSFPSFTKLFFSSHRWYRYISGWASTTTIRTELDGRPRFSPAQTMTANFGGLASRWSTRLWDCSTSLIYVGSVHSSTAVSSVTDSQSMGGK